MHKIYCTNCFKSLGVPSRIEIYNYITKNGEATVTDVVDMIGLTQPTVSYHLKEMKENGILNSMKKGKEVCYSINTICPHSKNDCSIKSEQFPQEQNE